MNIFGADFSGAKDASKGIYYCKGVLAGGTLSIERVIHCDDRLDLYAAIVVSEGCWGLDFPFGLTADACQALGIGDWEELLALAAGSSRNEFMALLENRLALQKLTPSYEAVCTVPTIACRATDAAAKAFSPLKKTNPNMRAMTYSGLKLLAYLRRAGVAVYPFDSPENATTKVYEVYPSALWNRVGMKRTTDMEAFLAKAGGLGLLDIKLSSDFVDVPLFTQDAADSVVACVIMAIAVAKYKVADHWDICPEPISQEEWKNRKREGAILRV